MLTVYRRHLDSCPKRAMGRRWRRCRCPIWLQGTLRGERIRRSMDLISWEAAVAEVRDLELGNGVQTVPVKTAVEKYLSDCAARLSPETVRKHRVVLARLEAFAEKQGIRAVGAFRTDDLSRFRERWRDSPVTAQKNLERLKSFFRFCDERGWAPNAAKVLRPPRVKPRMRMPFSDEEVGRILEAVDEYPTRNSFGYDNRARVRAFVLVLLHTGMRIRDVATLRKVGGESIIVATSKTGTPVRLPLPPVVLDAFKKVENGEYYFWSGNGEPKSAVADWQRSLRRLFKLAKVKGSAHSFRTTMAVRLLRNGVSVENVAAILGNTPAIVLKHYSPWVQSRQAALDAAMKELW